MVHIDGWLGLDIGGANIKVAFWPLRGEAYEAKSIPFALWKHPEQLATRLTELFSSYGNLQLRVAATMTGELADGYANRLTGVESIVEAVSLAWDRFTKSDQRPGSKPAIQSLENQQRLKPVFYGIGQTTEVTGARGHDWHDATSATANWTSVAAANWHAIAGCLRYLPRLEQPLNGFLIDIGSTTTDIIPIRNGLPAAVGLTDLTRLQAGELFYAGVSRTPICSLVQSLIIDQTPVTIARELFATIEDSLIVSGDIAEDEKRFDTADGRPATRAFALQRLAKMVCADAGSATIESNPEFDQQAQFLNLNDLASMAQQTISALRAGIIDSINCVVGRHEDLPKCFYISGQGDWLARQVLAGHFGSKGQIHNIADIVGKSNSPAMAALAVAMLAANELSTSEASIAVGQRDTESFRVIKIGGSLLEFPDSPKRIQRWLNGEPQVHKNVWIVGGGKMVDQIRDFDTKFQLTESTAHWLALDAMALNLRMIQHWFPAWPLLDDWAEVKSHFKQLNSGNVLFDFRRWLKLRPLGAIGLPESWEVTSDSCAAFLAQQEGAKELVLLKSCPIEAGASLAELAESGVVDVAFPKCASNIRRMQLVNLNADD